MPIESGLRGRSRGCISGSDIVSVMPQICMSGAPKRVCQSSSSCTVTFCAYETARSFVRPSAWDGGCASSMRIGAAKSAASVAS